MGAVPHALITAGERPMITFPGCPWCNDEMSNLSAADTCWVPKTGGKT